MAQVRFSDDRSIFTLPEHPAGNAIAQVATGVGKAVEGLIAFPYTTASHIFAGSNTLQNNILTRTVETVNHMVYGTADLLTAHLLYSGAKALGIEQHTPFFTPFPKTIEGVASEVTNLAFMAVLPAAGRAVKARMGIPEKTVPVAETPLARQLALAAQKRAEVVLAKIMAEADAAFARAWQNTAPASQMGAIDISWMAGARKLTYVDAFRQEAVTIADLEAVLDHADINAKAAAQQVLAERTAIVPAGYVQIPGGAFKGQEISPFAMKAKPVTNAEWLQGVDGHARYILLKWDKKTGVVTIEDILDKPPALLSTKINLDAGEIVTKGAQVLVKLVDNPSQVCDESGRIFSGGQQPVVGVTYFHAKAWLQAQTMEAGGKRVYGLPTDLQYEAIASNFGKQEYGTEMGQLFAADGRKLAHFGEAVTAAVDDPRYPAGPFGVQTTGNVWRWTEANLQETYPYGLRGGSWFNDVPGLLRAAFRSFNSPVYRGNDVGFSPVVLAQDSIKIK